MVQKFVHTGRRATTYRLTTFLGAVLFAYSTQANDESPDLSAPDSVIEAADFTQKARRTITFECDDDMLVLARKVAQAFPDVPLLGIDIIRDVNTARLWVLEINGGGNTWHFSSDTWAERRRDLPHLARDMKTQFSAFDTAAAALVEKTLLLAS